MSSPSQMMNFIIRMSPRVKFLTPSFSSVRTIVRYQTPKWGIIPKHFRSIYTSPPVTDIFSVQDEQDFKDKVLNSKKPVIVEFHAT